MRMNSPATRGELAQDWLNAFQGTTQTNEGSTAMPVVLLDPHPRLCRLNISPGSAKLTTVPCRSAPSSTSLMQPLRIMYKASIRSPERKRGVPRPIRTRRIRSPPTRPGKHRRRSPHKSHPVRVPLLESIQALKVERDAVIVAHNYQSPLITAGVADFIGDSLAMARFEAGCSLAESVDADYVRLMRRAHPGLPVVAYVNTTASAAQPDGNGIQRLAA